MAMRKKQNTRRSIADSVHKIYRAGMFVTAGFILGFDSEKGSVAEPMTELIEEAQSRSPSGCSRRCRTHSSRVDWHAKAASTSTTTSRRRVKVINCRRGEFRNQTAACGNPARSPPRAATDLQSRGVLRPHRAAGLAARLLRPSPESFPRATSAPDGTIRMVQELLSRLPEHRERFWSRSPPACHAIRGGARHRYADGLLSPRRPVLRASHRTDRSSRSKTLEHGRFVAAAIVAAGCAEAGRRQRLASIARASRREHR